MTNKPAAKKAEPAPDDVYSNSYVHPSNLDVGPNPDDYTPSFAPLPQLSVPVVVPADLKES